MTSQCELPWSRPDSGFSAVMEAFVLAFCHGMPVAHVARLTLMAYLVCGKLKHLPSSPWLTAATKPA